MPKKGKKFSAAAAGIDREERYGFKDIEPHVPQEYDTVKVEPSVGLNVLARCAGTTPEVIQELNPQLRRWALPPSPAKQTLRVPKDKGKSFLKAASTAACGNRKDG